MQTSQIYIIVLLNFLCHWQLLINDGLYHDGWITNYIRRYDFTYYWEHFLNFGKPIYAILYWPLAQASHWVFLYKLVALLCSLLTSFLLARAINRFKILKLNEVEIFAIASITCTFPAFEMIGEVSVLQYVFSFSIFLLGWDILFNRTLASKWIRLIICLILLTASFFTNSLLVYHYFIFALALFSKLEPFYDLKKSKFCRSLILLFIVYPCIFWISKKYFFPPQGVFSEYYALNFNEANLKEGFNILVFNLLVKIPETLIKNPFQIMLFLVTFFCVNYYLRHKHFSSIKENTTPLKPLFLIIIGIIGFSCAAIPYILVGQRNIMHGWSSKNNLLFCLPFGLISFAILQILTSFFRNKAFLITALSLAFTVCFIVQNNLNHLQLQFLSAKDSSLIYHLRNSPVAMQSSYFFLHDTSEIDPPSGSAHLDYHYNWYFIPFIITEAFHNYNRTGTYVYQPIKESQTTQTLKTIKAGAVPYLALPDVPDQGQQASIVISEPKPYSKGEQFLIAFRYYYYKFFNSSQMNEFLKNIFSIHIEQLK